MRRGCRINSPAQIEYRRLLDGSLGALLNHLLRHLPHQHLRMPKPAMMIEKDPLTRALLVAIEFLAIKCNARLLGALRFLQLLVRRLLVLSQ